MKNKTVSLASLKSDPGNVRQHSAANLAAIARSLERFGQQKPIVVDSDNVVRAGNGTLEAARGLGWTEIEAVVTDLSDKELLAYSVADNKTSELANWDYEGVAEVLQELSDNKALLEATGFSDYEIEPLLAASWDPTSEPMDAENLKARPVALTQGQREVFEQAVANVRRTEDDPSISEGRVIELLAADYLAGVQVD